MVQFSRLVKLKVNFKLVCRFKQCYTVRVAAEMEQSHSLCPPNGSQTTTGLKPTGSLTSG